MCHRLGGKTRQHRRRRCCCCGQTGRQTARVGTFCRLKIYRRVGAARCDCTRWPPRVAGERPPRLQALFGGYKSSLIDAASTPRPRTGLSSADGRQQHQKLARSVDVSPSSTIINAVDVGPRYIPKTYLTRTRGRRH